MAGEKSRSSTATTEEAQRRADVMKLLWDEFHRINDTHFGGTLELTEILLSTRKQYGGYYKRTVDRENAARSKTQIVLSWQAYTEHGWDETLNTFRHEVAHIVHQNHSAAFWALAARLGCTRRHALPPASRAHAYCRYVYECPVCHSQVFRRKRLLRSSCGRCDSKFNPTFQLRLVSSTATRSSAA